MEKDLQIKYSKALQEVQRERNALRAENSQLKQQLATREQIIKENKDLYDAKCFSMSAMEENHTQDKIEFAVAKLEKVKEKILSYEDIYYQFLDNGARVPVFCVENFRVRQPIDNLITEIKASPLEDKEGK